MLSRKSAARTQGLPTQKPLGFGPVFVTTTQPTARLVTKLIRTKGTGS